MTSQQPCESGKEIRIERGRNEDSSQGRDPAGEAGGIFFSLWVSVVVPSLKLSRLFLPWLGLRSLGGAEPGRGMSLSPQPQGPVTPCSSLSLLPGITLRSSILKS